MSVYLTIIILSFISGITTLIGAFLAFAFNKSKKMISSGIGFSAGIMLLISIFELIPESINQAGLLKAIIFVILGIIVLWVLNIIIPHTHLIEEKGGAKGRLLKAAYLVAFGLILHDFPEGFAMASSYLISTGLGIMVAISIALHNIPEEFAMAVPIIASGKSKGFLFKVAFLSGLAEPLGAIIGLVLAGLMPSVKPIFLAFAAGAMIFISLHELLPLAKYYKKILLFILGMVISLIVYLVLGLLINV